MDIAEVTEILGLTHFLPIPKHVFITPERVSEQSADGPTYFRGLQPIEKHDIIFLSRDANVSTIPHEDSHMLGLGELLAYPIGNAAALKYQIVSNFPRAKQLLSRKIQYRRAPVSSDFPQLAKYGDRVEHWELVE